jgi:SAM-dependent methyltransferase
MNPNASLDFGYPWWLSSGHLAIAIPALAMSVVAHLRTWGRWPRILLGLLALWATTVFLLMQFGLRVNQAPALPTQSFLANGTGRVLDIGAGTGRSTIMVLNARPNATVVATDEFGESFNHHFGHTDTPQQLLQKNLETAGVSNRAKVETADMRKLPYEPASFDAVVSAYAVDHLNRDGITAALSEVRRVLKPGGDFLLILVGNDRWAKFAFGPMLTHGGTRGRDWWAGRTKEAGFELREDGTTPGTLWLLLRPVKQTQ